MVCISKHPLSIEENFPRHSRELHNICTKKDLYTVQRFFFQENILKNEKPKVIML